MLVPFRRNPRTLGPGPAPQPDDERPRRRRRSVLDDVYRRIDEDLADR